MEQIAIKSADDLKLFNLYKEYGSKRIVGWVESRLRQYEAAKAPDKRERALERARERRRENKMSVEEMRRQLAKYKQRFGNDAQA